MIFGFLSLDRIGASLPTSTKTTSCLGAFSNAYDSANRLKTFTNATTTASYTYNGLNDRLQETAAGGVTTTFTMDLNPSTSLRAGFYLWLYRQYSGHRHRASVRWQWTVLHLHRTAFGAVQV
ncbi:MAG: hypothetical protein L6Q26_12850 [Anaerolineales bacterium]|nr:hypothetical protein [Anaerolineales bacterium]